MKNKISYFGFTIALLVFLPLIAFGQPRYFDNRLIIKYESDQKLQQIRSKTGADPQNAVQKILNRNGVRKVEPLVSNRLQHSIQQQNISGASEVMRIREVTFNRNINPVQMAAKINSMPGVEYAEPRYLRQTNLNPNDPRIEKYVEYHNFFDAWDISQGSRDVIIAINDSGVDYTHNDLDDNLWVNQDEVPPTLRPEIDQDSDGTITSTEVREYLRENNGDYNEDGAIDLRDAVHEQSPFMTGADSDDNGFTDDLLGWDFWSSGSANDPETDNNPIFDDSDHGTHVAGIAAAETNNDTAVAGASFNTTYMTVKTGGIGDEPELIGFGFDGILYAALNGADIINCSWSGESFSQAEIDIIELATEMGALVVASTGNAGNEQIQYPAGYDKVLSVASVTRNGSKAPYSNYGYKLDVLATGNDILSTSNNNELAVKTGTSMAAPVVSGLAALIKDVNPGWRPERIATQIRSTSTSIYHNHSDSFDHKLGSGAVNAFGAVDPDNIKPGLKILSRQFSSDDGDKLLTGESGSVRIILTNYGRSTSALELQLRSVSDNIEINNASLDIGSISKGDTVEVSFDLAISEDFDLRKTPILRLDFRDSNLSYNDFNIIQYEEIIYDIMASNNVKTSFAADGTIGFTDPLAGRGGVGFIPRTPDDNGYEERENILFEGGLMIEIDGEIYDAVRAVDGLSRDFTPQRGFLVIPSDNGSTGSGSFTTDTDTASQAVIEKKTYAINESGLQNVVFVEYIVQNPSDFVVMEDVYVGLFNDWDIGDAFNNNVSYSRPDSILHISDATSGSSQPVAAVAHLGPISSVFAIDNASQEQDSLIFGLYDGFTDNEKSTSLKAGAKHPEVSNTDVSAVVASGPYTINPGAEVTIGFVYAFGDEEGQLRNQISEARSRNLFAVSPTGRATADEVPDETELFQNYPNPFSTSTQLRIDLDQSTDVSLAVFDVLGRKVRILADEEFEAGSHFIRLDAGQLSSGTYFVRLETEYGVESIPVTLIKN